MLFHFLVLRVWTLYQGHAVFFSTLDLASGYNRVPVAEQDCPKTAFCTPFGLCNVPSTFHRLMQRMFRDQQGQSLLLYLDDIITFSSSVEQHLQWLEVVLRRLQKEGLKVKAGKCIFPGAGVILGTHHLQPGHFDRSQEN